MHLSVLHDPSPPQHPFIYSRICQAGLGQAALARFRDNAPGDIRCVSWGRPVTPTASLITASIPLSPYLMDAIRMLKEISRLCRTWRFFRKWQNRLWWLYGQRVWWSFWLSISQLPGRHTHTWTEWRAELGVRACGEPIILHPCSSGA